MVRGLLLKNKHNKLIKTLEQEGVFSKDQLKDFLKIAKESDKSLAQCIIEHSKNPDDKAMQVISEVLDLPTIDLRRRVIAQQVLNLIPHEIAARHSVVIFKKIKDIVCVATTQPENNQTIDFIRKKTGLEPQIFITTPQEIKFALHKYNSELSQEFGQIIEDSTKEALAQNESVEKMAQFVPMIKMVDTILERALMQGASDIHVQPSSDTITIRFRVDGMLYNIVELPREIHPAIIARIKILANLKIDTHTSPQDGRFSYHFNDREVSIRVSIIPTMHGSKIVMRLLDMENDKFTLRRLGLNKRDFQLLRAETAQPHGMILVTGPTGSGKTTTLYTLLHLLNREDLNICTIEDPVEYGINGVSQTQINPAADLTFANGLKSLLRQDPDILMVGEIRDADTAHISVNAAMTGHLVLSTLHTNNAFMTPERLLEMKVPAYLVGSVVSVIISQRLVRKVCPDCRVRVRNPLKHLEEYQQYLDIEGVFNKVKNLGLLASSGDTLDDLQLLYGKGCDKCNQTGFRGRIGIYEIIKVDDAVRKAILEGASPDLVQQRAQEQGALSLAEDGLLKVFNGRTTIDEVLRVIKD